jgi:hypothetical protein
MSAEDLDVVDDSFLDASRADDFLSESENLTPQTGSRLSPEPSFAFGSLSDSDGDASPHDSPLTPSSRSYASNSIFGDLADELAGDDAPIPEGKGLDARLDRISNFFQVPGEIEPLLLYGFFICLDSFLYVFTILPLRCLRHVFRLLFTVLGRKNTAVLLPQQRSDLIKLAIIAIVSRLLSEIDTSVVYHGVRGQSVVKLYVIFNVLEILDKLCSSFGNDILDSMYLNTRDTSSSKAGVVFSSWWRFLVACCYVWIHSLVFFYQCTTLQVAINSYNNALLTLLLSNQFVEVKGSVFKKYERENMFQLTCADIVERFQLTVFLMIVGVRNYLELSGAGDFSADDGAVGPTSFLNGLRGIISSLPDFSARTVPLALQVVWPLGLILGSELLVDWLKHAFVTKFNAMEPGRLYRSFGDKLAREIVGDPNHNRRWTSGTAVYAPRQLVDHSPLLSKRMGFSVLPLICLVIRVGLQIAEFLGLFDRAPSPSVETGTQYLQHILYLSKLAVGGMLLWTFLLVFKLKLSRVLLDYSAARVQGNKEADSMRYPDAHVFPAPLAKRTE